MRNKVKKLHASKRIAYAAIIVGSLVAFLIGLHANILYTECILVHQRKQNAKSRPPYPCPVLKSGKEFPRSKYTCMLFNNSITKLYSKYLKLKKEEQGESMDAEEVCTSVDGPGYKKCSIDSTQDETSSTTLEPGNVNNEHPASGQHLMVDIKNVDSDFLASSERLAEALLEIINETNLTLLSYHCHDNKPSRVSCVGILLQSHISVHSWPKFGIVALDLYTCGPGDLVPMIPEIERIFAIATPPKSNGDLNERPCMVWTHKLRGSQLSSETLHLGRDLGSRILERDFDLKIKVASTETESQRIDLFDFIRANHSLSSTSYNQGLSRDESYINLHPEFFRRQRSLFLNGVLRSSRDGVEAFYEAFVQPGMFSHNEPEKVLILGGGEAAILREVLKHNTVKSVIVVENNKHLVQFAKDYLPCWSDCSDLQGSAHWCGNDKRAKIFYKDPVAWLLNRFKGTKRIKHANRFDVIIIDTLNPESGFPHNIDSKFIDILFNSLADDGIVIFQLGRAPHTNDPYFNFLERSAWIPLLFRYLEEAGFESMHIYEDGNGHLFSPWVYLVVMKDSESRELWYQTQAQLEVEMHKRIQQTYSGLPALKYFDSTRMRDYRYPHRNFETNFCHQNPIPESCKIIRDEIEIRPDIPVSDLEVRLSGVGDYSGRGLYTNVDIKKDTSIGRMKNAHPVVIHPSATNHLERWSNYSIKIRKAFEYVEGYGWQNNLFGENTYLVDSSILTFTNHGCNGTFNVINVEFGEHDDPYAITEMTEHLSDTDDMDDRDLYDPVLDRRGLSINAKGEVAVRNIKAGEEILTNYVYYSSRGPGWTDSLKSLREMCTGEKAGLITELEDTEKKLVQGINIGRFDGPML